MPRPIDPPPAPRPGWHWLPLVLAVVATSAGYPASAASWGQATGRVFADANGNGLADADEQGVAGILVSNGRDLVATDAQGRYTLEVRPDDVLFVVRPAEWRIPAGKDGLPAFWRRLEGRAPAAATALAHLQAGVDFALHPAPPRRGARAAGLDVLVLADPQVKSKADVGYYEADIIAPLLAGPAPHLAVVLGDVVDDVPALYPAINAVGARLGVPWLHAAGNHDVDPDARADTGSLAAFRATYGPDTFAWEEAEASFVVLDDVIAKPGQRPAYVGGLREEQFAFLSSYLAARPRDRLLVLALHIPLFDTAQPGAPETFRRADRERLFALLRDVPRVLVLSGHRHGQSHRFHGRDDGWHGSEPLHEYNVGAASGAYWSGAPDAMGIPDATMADGTPNGHARLRVAADGSYRLSWHPARHVVGDPASTAAMALHAPRVLRQGAYPAWGVYANVYMGHAGSRVEYRIDDGPWRPMARVPRPDPRLLRENVRDDVATTLRGFDRSPEAEVSPHLWRGTLPTDLAPGTHRVEVRAFDDWQGEQLATTEYRLDRVAR